MWVIAGGLCVVFGAGGVGHVGLVVGLAWLALVVLSLTLGQGFGLTRVR
jgi:hypothetical protein